MKIRVAYVMKGFCPDKDHPTMTFPIHPEDPSVIAIDVDSAKAIDFDGIDHSFGLCGMLKGTSGVEFTHLSLSFFSPEILKGLYMNVERDYGPTSLTISFTHSNGNVSKKEYEFSRPKEGFEWGYLPVELEDVIKCDIDVKDCWDMHFPNEFELGNPLPSISGLLAIRSSIKKVK
ncbi:hypothetical protein ADUPG1_004678 [Aduncisulcus paluster]|uniref:Uncharacterized protein n=1 Tax=Aduncisulcus paluster TaxID=2918883 RepID=A0ABQ5K299_9EUKA|nr:hypothetical protein ADUPG1_004678 [Aduncisulcus paluster]